MLKKIAGAALAVAFAVTPFAASAASISNALFSNGQTTIDATGGSTVSGTFTLTVGQNETVEWLRSQSDTMPFTDTSVGGSLGYQEGVYTNVPFSVKVAPNTGTYNVTEQGAGTFGGNRSINGGDNVVVGATSLGTVRVVTNSTSDSTGGSSTGVFGFSSFAEFLAAIKAAMTPAPTTPVPTVSTACATLSTKLVGTVDNSYNDANVRLQGYLLSEGASIPALAAGASFGYKGPQTRAAVSAFVVSHNCN